MPTELYYDERDYEDGNDPYAVGSNVTFDDLEDDYETDEDYRFR